MWVLLGDDVVGAAGETAPETTPEGARTVNGASDDASEILQVKLLEERVKAQEDLIAMYRRRTPTGNTGITISGRNWARHTGLPRT